MTHPAPRWTFIDPVQAQHLADARHQVHHALQFVSALGISFLPAAADDGHTNLGWEASLDALVSRHVPGPQGETTVALRVADLALLVRVNHTPRAVVPLHGQTLEHARAALATHLAVAGLDGARYHLRRHFDIPPHEVAGGAPFDASDRPAFHALGQSLANAHAVLEPLAKARGGSEVRLWPHHADLATLFTLAPGRTTGAGLALGDGYYQSPYFYVNAYPTPDRSRLTDTLGGAGRWHTHEWVGAVLPLTDLAHDGELQGAQIHAYLDSALRATTRLLS